LVTLRTLLHWYRWLVHWRRASPAKAGRPRWAHRADRADGMGNPGWL